MNSDPIETTAHNGPSPAPDLWRFVVHVLVHHGITVALDPLHVPGLLHTVAAVAASMAVTRLVTRLWTAGQEVLRRRRTRDA